MKIIKGVNLSGHLPDTIYDGKYLMSARFDTADGRGDMAFTVDPRKALRFADFAMAMQCYTTRSATVPLRPDGKPNRPLTALSIEVVEAPEPGGPVARMIERTSPISGKTRILWLGATEDQWAALDKGDLIQRALPHLSDGEREFIMTGISDDEWGATFPTEDEEAPFGAPGRSVDRSH